MLYSFSFATIAAAFIESNLVADEKVIVLCTALLGIQLTERAITGVSESLETDGETKEMPLRCNYIKFSVTNNSPS